MLRRDSLFLRSLPVIAFLAVAFATPAEPMDKKEALDQARAALAPRAESMGLQGSDLEDLIVTNSYTSKHNGVTHIYVRQRLNGIELANGTTTLNLGRGGKLISAGNRLVTNLRGRINTNRPSLERDEAIRTAADALGLVVVDSLIVLQDLGGPAQEAVFSPAGISLDPITIRLAYYDTHDGVVRLAWEMFIRQPDQRHAWHLWLDATTGDVLAKVDWIASDSYQALEIPLEDPGEDGDPFDEDRTIIADPADPSASPFGWHDTNGVAGAEFTDTRGNNVNAQEDRDGNNAGGSRPSGGASLDFTSAMDLSTEQPSSHTDAATLNLFYWNNVLHDALHHYGFDEASGNFQEFNYSGMGIGTDPVEADAQDNADGVPPSSNNANFFTPPEPIGVFGSPPRMQMFEWLAPPDLTVNTPAGIAGPYATAGASFGPRLDMTGVTGDLEVVSDGTGNPTEGCNALVGFTPGRIAVIDRGNCEFGTKVLNAENAGASAAIVANNAGDGLINMGAGAQGGSVTISSLFIGQTDGATIKGQLPAPGVNATMATTQLDRDSDFDNGIIAHEYCHGLSNRLTGGAASASCLSGDQQAGEGWSDWCTLFFGAKASDLETDDRGVGNYVIFETPTGPGIRPAPYSTDLGVNSLTYGILTGAPGNGISIPHGVGTVWATALWDMYWNLVNAYGFDPDLYTGTGGNNVAMQLVVDGLKMQPCNPTFLDARDAILAADVANNGGANECHIWNAFAKRGMGLSAADGGSSASLAVTEAFDKPAPCLNTAPVVNITAPLDGTTFDDADSIGFTGTATDAEDGDITADLDWTSSLDGMIGTTGSFSTMLSPGVHTITADVMDSGGLSGSDDITLLVTDLSGGCVADTTATGPDSGTVTYEAVNSVTFQSTYLADGTSDVTAEAGVSIVFEDDTTFENIFTAVLTPTPCD